MVTPYGTDDEDNRNNNANVLELELDSKVRESGIVESFIFDIEASSVILSLNHVYDRKTVICPINTKRWDRSSDNFSKQLLSKKGISKEHTIQLCDVLDLNYNRIRRFQEENANSKAATEESEEEEEERIENVLEGMYHFKTMQDTKEIYWYDDIRGLYRPAGEIIIET